MSVPVAVHDLLTRPVDGAGDVGGQRTELVVRACGCLLDHGEIADEGRVVRELYSGDGEVLDTAQRLDAVERIRWNLPCPEQVVLAAGSARRIRLLEPDLAGAGVQQALVHRARDPRQHLDRRCAVLGEPRQHLLAIQLEHRQVGVCAR